MLRDVTRIKPILPLLSLQEKRVLGNNIKSKQNQTIATSSVLFIRARSFHLIIFVTVTPSLKYSLHSTSIAKLTNILLLQLNRPANENLWFVMIINPVVDAVFAFLFWRLLVIIRRQNKSFSAFKGQG